MASQGQGWTMNLCKAGKLGLAVLLLVIEVTDSLHIEDVFIPMYPTQNQTITMDCVYKLSEGEYVDSIKWYKDNEEFYRILPNPHRERDKVVIFKKPGINLDRQNSGLLKAGTHQLVLKNLTLNATGRYMCQITESKPPFHTAQMEKNMHVIIPPDSGPEIHSLGKAYTVDTVIDVLCTSGKSYPAPRLDFFINDKPVGEHFITRYPNQTFINGLQTASIGLQYPVKAKNIISDDMSQLSIKCRAKIWDAYWQSVVQKTTFKRLGRMLESRSNGVPTKGASHPIHFAGMTMVISILMVHYHLLPLFEGNPHHLALNDRR
ncbi:uncharacterized protein LOC131890669 [Tigriopus californicus]|uniref:uncharacterized protein LOC131890669 n=1 Tax=Tigriopus californicus TaxID=6832 RepID=UPI0027D9E083|nr:uncharacterized protein LOC131890669 [Tigriopus californicus]